MFFFLFFGGFVDCRREKQVSAVFFAFIHTQFILQHLVRFFKGVPEFFCVFFIIF